MEEPTKIEIHHNEPKTWYNLAEGFDKWRVFPRLLITLYPPICSYKGMKRYTLVIRTGNP